MTNAEFLVNRQQLRMLTMTNDGEVKSEKQGEDKAQAGLGKQCAGQQGAATCFETIYA